MATERRPDRDDPGRELTPDDEEEVEGAPVPDEPARRGGGPEWVAVDYSAPMPPPGMLGQYNDVLPGLANRIATMAEKEQSHSHKMDRVYAGLRVTGQLAAFAIAMVGLLVGADLIRDGHSIEGLAALFGGLGPVVAAFLYRQIKHGNGGA